MSNDCVQVGSGSEHLLVVVLVFVEHGLQTTD